MKCFGLKKKFLLKNIFTKYPEIANEIKANAHMRYQKYLKKPINERFKKDIKMKNKKSSYNMVKYEEKGSVPEMSDFLHNFTTKNPFLQKYSSRGKCLNFLNSGNIDKIHANN